MGENRCILPPCWNFRNEIFGDIVSQDLPRLRSLSPEDEEVGSMALKITNHEVDGVTVVALDGRIVLGEETNSLRETVKKLLADGKKKVVLDLKNVSLIDSAGLGTLVSVRHSANSRGTSLRLCNLGTRTNELLQVTKLVTVFEVSNSEAEAIRSFA
jgi:anti-sigma B factor antagonist